MSLILFFFITAINAQKADELPLETSEDDGTVCGLLSPVVVTVSFSVINSKNEYLKNLTYKDFEIYENNTLQLIEFFKFDELKNQYLLGIFKEDPIKADKNRGAKIEVKLTKEKEKFYGNIVIKELSKIYPDQD